jgi:hypothetical protein
MPAGGEIIVLCTGTAMLSFIEIAVTDRRDFPHFDVNPNSGEPESKADHPRIAENRIPVDS